MNTKFAPQPVEPPSEVKMERPKEASPREETKEDLHKLITEMSDKIQSLETKLSSLNDKMDAQKFNLALLTRPNQGKAAEISPLPTENSELTNKEPAPIPHDPEAGFKQDEPIQTFRKSLILYQALKYPETILAFSDFLERFPDHILAGAAQFYIAESYMKQKEYKLALQEYQKLLTTYEKDAHISDALRQMAQAETILRQSEDAARHRHLLTSLFPLSPSATRLESEKKESAATQPQVAESNFEKSEKILENAKESLPEPTPEPLLRGPMSIPPTANVETDSNHNEKDLESLEDPNIR